MSDTKEFLTVAESVIFSNKSDKTIRNLIENFKVVDKKSGEVASNDTSKVLVKKDGRKFYYLVSSLFLKEKYLLVTGTSNTDKTTSKVTSNKEKDENIKEEEADSKEKNPLLATINILQGQLLVKDEQINIKDLQIERKDKQLEQEQELNKNNQVLLKEEQNKNKILENRNQLALGGFVEIEEQGEIKIVPANNIKNQKFYQKLYFIFPTLIIFVIIIAIVVFKTYL